jgi:hypothetical protein
MCSYANKLDTLNEMGKFLKRQKLLNVTKWKKKSLKQIYDKERSWISNKKTSYD